VKASVNSASRPFWV